jgi:GAF domain-containing protein
MTDPERDHFIRHIRDLERSRGRWRLAALVLGGALLLPVVACGGLVIVLGPAWQLQRRELDEARVEQQRALAAQQAAQAQQAAAEQALQKAKEQANKMRPPAEKDQD